MQLQRLQALQRQVQCLQPSLLHGWQSRMLFTSLKLLSARPLSAQPILLGKSYKVPSCTTC